jgi:hypothetical protein
MVTFLFSFIILSSICRLRTCLQEEAEKMEVKNLSSKYQMEGAMVNQFRKLEQL